MKKQAIFATLLAAVTGVAFAGSMEKGEKMSYQQLDQNGDGYISPEEATANPALAEQFDALDANGNSQLDQGEFAQFEGQGESKK